MLSCLLMHTGVATSSENAVSIFGNTRTEDGKGITIPSQRRYVQYYEHVLKQGMPQILSRRLSNLIVYTSPNVSPLDAANKQLLLG